VIKERTVDCTADQVVARWAERHRIDCRRMDNRAKKLAAAERVDLHRVATGDRSSVAGSRQRRNAEK